MGIDSSGARNKGKMSDYLVSLSHKNARKSTTMKMFEYFSFAQVVFHAASCGQNGDLLGSDEEEIAALSYVLLDVRNNKVRGDF